MSAARPGGAPPPPLTPPPDGDRAAQGANALKARGDRRLLEGSISRNLLRFALPLLTTHLLHSLAGTWTAIWVSHTLGANALIAVVNGNIFMMLVMGAAMGVGMSAGVAIGQSRGAGNTGAIKRMAGSAVSFVVLLAVGVALAGILAAPTLVDVMRIPASARADAITYLRVTCASMPSLFLLIVLMMMLRGTGDARTPFRFTLVWIGVGGVLSPALLTGAFGLPALGIAGVALGGLIGCTTAMVAMILHIYRARLPLALRGAQLRHLRPEPELVGLLVRRGLPMALETLIVQGSYYLMLSMVNAHGAATAAAYSAAAQLWNYVQMPALAIASSMSAMAAINIGAGHWPRVERIALRGCLISAGVTTLATAILYAMGDAPLRLFLPDGGESLAIARSINYQVLWGWIAISVSLGLSAMVRANAAMLAPTLIYLVTMWLIRIPFAAWMQPVIGLSAIWLGFPLGTITSALMAWAYFRWGGWRRNRPMLAAGRGGGAP